MGPIFLILGVFGRGTDTSDAAYGNFAAAEKKRKGTQGMGRGAAFLWLRGRAPLGCFYGEGGEGTGREIGAPLLGALLVHVIRVIRGEC